MKNKNQNLIIIIVFGIILRSFFWFQYRPSAIKKGCSIIARDRSAERDRKIQTGNPVKYVGEYYQICLHERGI